MAPTALGILDLSNELLRDILDFIEADPDKLVSLDRRAYLSQESFRLPPPPAPDQAQVIGNFRLVCRRFSDLGAIHQFARLATRFTRSGFERLEKIASQEHLARHVKKFSYMVPYFCSPSPYRPQERLPQLPQSMPASDARIFLNKIAEHREILSSGEDTRTLKTALAAFTSLQHVQILRVQDRYDAQIIDYTRQHRNPPLSLQLNWEPACSHCTKTLGVALLESQSPCSRFSSPMLSPKSAEILAVNVPGSYQSLASRLTSLELHFDGGQDLDQKMASLSGLFRKTFYAATNMQAIHIGFPSYNPLSLPLEDIFHDVKWDRLAAFGIQAWRLNTDEICDLVGRHRDRLCGLRLRDVLLNDGNKWKDVLGFLRAECPRLDWVSLRRIGYSKHFNEQAARGGVEIFDDPLSNSDSDDDDDDDDFGDSITDSDVEAMSPDDVDEDSIHSADQSHGSAPTHHGLASDDGDDDDDDGDDDGDDEESEVDDSNEDSDSDSEHGPQAYSMDFPSAALRQEMPSPAASCRCASEHVFPDSPDDLGDSGLFVTNAQRKVWEKWVVRHHHCPVHPDTPGPSASHS